MDMTVKAMHTTSQFVLLESFFHRCLNVLRWFQILTSTQAIDAVTFDFKGSRVRCFVSAYTDYQIDYS